MSFTSQLQKKSIATSQPIPLSTGMFGSRSVQRQVEPEEDAVQMRRQVGMPDYASLVGNDPRAGAVQAKLTVGAPNDKYEQEADAIAARVMTMPDGAAQASVQREAMPEEEEVQMQRQVAGITPLVQREEMPEEEEVQAKSLGSIQREEVPEEEEIQAKSLGNIQREAIPEEEEVQTKPLQRSADGSMQAGGAVESQLSSSKGGGSPLAEDVRAFMEPRFGADFSGVRVHTGGDAVQMSRDLNAQAFTHGQDVYFGAGKGPGKDELTAHELTHVVQQTAINTIQRQTSESDVLHASDGDWTQLLSSKSRISIEQKEEIIKSIKQQRESVQDRIKTKDTPGLSRNKGGYVYNGDPNKSDPKPSFSDPNPRKAKIHQWVWEELAREGSSAAINTYDGQLLTWGRGFAASGQLEKKMMILFEKDPEIKDLLFNVGFTYKDNEWLAVNTDSGRIAKGKQALALVKNNVKILSLLIEIAENPEHNQNVVDSEFETIQKGAGNVKSWAYDWDEQAIKFAAHCVHWGGSWEQYHSTNGNIREIARVKAHHPDPSHVEDIRGGSVLIKEGPTNSFMSFAKGALKNHVERPKPLPEDIDVGPKNSIFFKVGGGNYYHLP